MTLDGYMSDWLPMSRGVPQGSFFGHILFIVYVDDLDVHLDGNVLKIADDADVFLK